MRSLLLNLLGFLALTGFYLVGELLVLILSIPMPGALVGLLLLLVTLLSLRRIPFMLSQGAAPLLNHMTVLFVPAISAVVLFWDDIEQHLPGMIAAIVLSTIVSLAIAGWIARLFFLPKQEK